MFKAIGWLIKLSIFAAVVLVLGNYFRFGGKTVSDQVKTQMAKAESLEMPTQVRGWTKGLLGDAHHGAQRASAGAASGAAALRPRPIEQRPEEGTEIPSSERQKLKALIRDLNTSYGRD